MLRGMGSAFGGMIVPVLTGFGFVPLSLACGGSDTGTGGAPSGSTTSSSSVTSTATGSGSGGDGGGPSSGGGGAGGGGAGGGGGSSTTTGTGGCTIVPPPPCPTGVPSGTPASASCGSAPLVTDDGYFPLPFSSATSEPNLGCTLNYPEARSVALSVCTQYKAFLGMAFAPAQAAYAVGLRTDCMTLDSCASATSLPLPLAPGTKTLFIEGYGAEDGAVTLSFARPTALTPVTDCCAAQQDAEDMGPLTPPMTLTAQSVGNGITGFGPSCAPDTESTSITALRLTESVQLTVVAPPVVGKTVGYFGLREDCNADGTDLACKQGPGLFTTAAGPGLYYLTAQHNTFDGTVFANIFVEPPVTPTSNLACASATQLLLNQAFHEQRIVGGTPDPNLPGRFLRFYSFTTSAPGNLVFQLIGWTGAGNATYSIRSNCADPASELASGQISGTQSWSSFLPGLPAGTYFAVVSADEGFDYTIDL